MLLFLKIKPNQRFDRLERIENEWVVKIKAPAQDGQANEHLVKFMSEILDLPKSKIHLKKGATSRNKCLDINADENYINNRLEQANQSLHNTL